MNKVQIIIFVVIVLTFGILFYTTQSDSWSFNQPKEAVSISDIPEQLDYITSTPSHLQQPSAQPQAKQNEIIDPQTLEPYKTASATAIVKTSKGNITLTLYGEDAPYAVANFIKKTKDGFYNNLIFHRVEGWVIQGGDPTGTGMGGGKIASELNDKPFVEGSLGLARTPVSKDISNDSQFFITKNDASHLNGDYVNFGIVTEGMDVVNQIAIGDKILGITIQ